MAVDKHTAEHVSGILKDDFFLEVVALAKAEICQEWQDEEVEFNRERLWNEIQAIDRVMDRMRGMVNESKAANRTAERTSQRKADR